MPVLRFDIDTRQSTDSLAAELTLYAAEVFRQRFPDDEAAWRGAMTELVQTINEHVRTTLPEFNRR